MGTRLPVLALCALPLAVLGGCAKDDGSKGNKAQALSCDASDTRVAMVNGLWFGRQEAGGVGPGFDLDGRVSDAIDGLGCNKPDLTDPSGLEGVDSAFSSLVPVLEQTEAAAVEGLIQDSIRSGELLLAIELTGVDDTQNDDCITMEMVRGDGIPLIGTDGNLLDSQTFERHPTIAPGVTETAWIEDGMFQAEGMSMALELQVLDEFLEFQLEGGKIRGQLHEDGSITGVFAGGIPVAQILYEFDLGDIDVADLIATAVPAAADLYNEETGECDAISITFEFDAAPAYLFDENGQ